MSEELPKKSLPAKKISLKETKHFDRKGFSGDVYIDTNEGMGYNALVVDVHGRHYKTGIKGATRNYLVLEGKGTFTLDGETHQVKQGDLYIIPDGHNYEYEGEMKLFEFNVPGTNESNETNLDEVK